LTNKFPFAIIPKKNLGGGQKKTKGVAAVDSGRVSDAVFANAERLSPKVFGMGKYFY
jgi:hypothetical protein